MAKNSTILLTHQGHLTDAAISAYVEGRLPDAQHDEFLKYLAEDSFAQEAVEGLKLTSPKAVIAKLEEIHLQLQEKTGAGKKKSFSLDIHWSVFAYAAALIGLLVGVGFMFTWYKQNAQETQLAMVEKVDTLSFNNEEVVTPEVAPTILEDTTTEFFNDRLESEVPASAPIASVTMPVEEVAAPALGDMKAKKELAKDDAPAAARGAASAPAKMTAERTEDALRVTNDMSAKSFDKAQSAQSTYQQGMQQFNSGDYKQAEQTFGEVTQSSPENFDAVYFEGVSSYINGNNNKAEQNFDKLLKKGAYSEGSKWYKANILLKKGKTEEAKKLLNDLSGASGIFKERAVKKLESLD